MLQGFDWKQLLVPYCNKGELVTINWMVEVLVGIWKFWSI